MRRSTGPPVRLRVRQRRVDREAGQRPNLRVPVPLDPSPHPPPCRTPQVQRRQRHALAFTNAHLPRFVPRPKLSFIAMVDFGQTGAAPSGIN